MAGRTSRVPLALRINNWLHYAAWIVWQGPQASQTLLFYWPHLSILPTAGHVLSAHAHNPTYYYVGKGRQQAHTACCRTQKDGGARR